MTDATLDILVAQYAAGHRNHRNEVIHCICVPAIVFAVVGAVLAIGNGFALLTIAAAIYYYSRLGPNAATEMSLVLVLMLAAWVILLPHHHRIIIATVIFIAAWIGQFIGHHYEGTKPAFLDDLRHLSIGPLYVLAVLKRKLHGAPPIIP